jgi:hypothetical protein
MTMTPGQRKFALTLHVISSIGWFGSVLAFLALVVAALSSRDELTVRPAYLAMELTARFVIVPLALASLLTGVVQSLGTPWGLFRHYWVLVKLLATLFATVILLMKMALIGDAARIAATEADADLHAAGLQLLVHTVGGLLVLLAPAVLSVYKPPGMTGYGWRKQQQRGAQPD